MTTVAVRAGHIACDGRVIDGEAVFTDWAAKIGRIATPRGSILFGCCGQASWGWAFRSWLREGARAAYEPKPNKESTGIVLLPNGRLLVMSDFGWELHKAPYAAIGSGAHYALGAMAAGANVELAVRCAIKHDPYSGGHVTVLKR